MFPFLPLGEWVAILRAHRVDRRYALRTLTGVGFSVASAPLRLYETARHGRAVARVALHPAPVFILGCARSGTTHLHNLLAQDPQFGFVTNFQALAQSFALSGSRWLRPLLARLGPGRRPMDNVALELDGPQEEDLALAGCSRHSALWTLLFPRDTERLFKRYVLMQLSAAERRSWADAYLGVLRKATLASDGKPLLLKSPTNTGRVPALLDLFPRARFVHIHRDPYVVFRSIESSYRTLLPLLQLQAIEPSTLEDQFVHTYQLMLRRFLDDSRAIPAGQFAELRFDDLEARPLEELARIYQELSLGDFAPKRLPIAAYLQRLGTYTKNESQISDRVVARVNRDWGFALEAFGYPQREPAGDG